MSAPNRTPTQEEYDIYADENEPGILSKMHVISYRIVLPNTDYSVKLAIEPENNGYVTIQGFNWFGKVSTAVTEHRERESIYREIWEWLVEWEFVQLQPIGPEDSEYFATDKLNEAWEKI